MVGYAEEPVDLIVLQPVLLNPTLICACLTLQGHVITHTLIDLCNNAEAMPDAGFMMHVMTGVGRIFMMPVIAPAIGNVLVHMDTASVMNGGKVTGLMIAFLHIPMPLLYQDRCLDPVHPKNEMNLNSVF